MNGILNMIFRMLLRRGMHIGINKGLDYIARKKSQDPNDSTHAQNQKNTQQTAQNAKRAIHTVQRFRKF